MKSRSLRALRKRLQEQRATVLQNAIAHCRATNDSVRKTAKLFSLPESTLRPHIKRNANIGSVGHPTYFTPVEEAELAQHIKKMARLGYGYQRWQVCEVAENMLASKGVKVTVGKDWYYGFIVRNKLNTKVPKKRSIARVQGGTDSNIANYFDELEKFLIKHELLNMPASIWNVDETGITLDFPPPKIATGKGEKPYIITSGRRATTTVIAAGSALGETIPPYIVYKGERLMTELTQGCLPGTKFTMTRNGWSTSVTFLDFFKNHFLPTVTQRPCLLLYDGHATHITSDVLEVAGKEGVHMFVLPAHSSHLVQPLYVGVFGPFKAALASEAHKLCHAEVGRQIVRSDLPHLIATAYKSAMTTPNLMSAFRKTGVFPFSPEAVCNEKENEKPELKVKTRKERKDVRTMKLLLSEIDTNVQDKLEKLFACKTKDYIIPEHGAAVTEVEFIDKLKMKAEKTNTKAKEERKSKPKKSVDKRKLNETQEEQVKGKKKVKHTATNKTSTHQACEIIDSQKSGPSKEMPNWITTYNTEDESSDTENDDANCIICGKFVPPGFGKSGRLEILDWAKCDVCNEWVHLKYCTSVVRVLQNDPFKCPKC